MPDICPKCQELLPDNPERWYKLNLNPARNALSRRDNKTDICDVCGYAEAFADHLGMTDKAVRENLGGQSIRR
jgi:hypothetical protein